MDLNRDLLIQSQACCHYTNPICGKPYIYIYKFAEAGTQGLEPRSAVLETGILPLYETHIWLRIMDLNHDFLIQSQACCRYTNPAFGAREGNRVLHPFSGRTQADGVC